MTSYIPFKLLRTGFNKNTKLLVQDTKKLPQDVSYLRGRMVKFIRCIGNMVNVYDTRNVKKYIPLEYVLSYEEYTVTSNPTLFDTMFIVVAKNDYDFQIGAVFETTVMSCGNDLIFYTDNNERITLHSSWVKTISAPAKTAKIQDLVEKFNPQVVQEIPLEIAVTTTTSVIETELEVEESSESSLFVFNFVSKDVHPFKMF